MGQIFLSQYQITVRVEAVRQSEPVHLWAEEHLWEAEHPLEVVHLSEVARLAEVPSEAARLAEAPWEEVPSEVDLSAAQ